MNSGMLQDRVGTFNTHTLRSLERDFERYHRANMGIYGVETALGSGINTAMSTMSTLIAIQEGVRWASMAKQGTLWARAAALVASWGPFFWIPLAAVVAALITVAGLAAQHGSSSPTSFPGGNPTGDSSSNRVYDVNNTGQNRMAEVG